MNTLQLLQNAKRYVAGSALLDESDLTTEVDSAIPIATWIQWLNDSQSYHMNEVIQCSQEYFGASSSISWVSGTQEYDMPSQNIRIRMIQRTDTDPDRVILPITINDRVRYEPNYPEWFNNIDRTHYSYLWDNVIGFAPEPTSTGTLTVLFIRRLPDLMYGTASSATASTIVFPATPDLGTLHIEDDYYNNAKVKIVSATAGAGQTRKITDYVGSTRTATVAFSPTPTGTIVYSIECEIPEEYHPAVAMYAAIISKVVDEDQADNIKSMWNELRTQMIAGIIPRQTQGPRYCHVVDW